MSHLWRSSSDGNLLRFQVRLVSNRQSFRGFIHIIIIINSSDFNSKNVESLCFQVMTPTSLLSIKYLKSRWTSTINLIVKKYLTVKMVEKARSGEIFRRAFAHGPLFLVRVACERASWKGHDVTVAVLGNLSYTFGFKGGAAWPGGEARPSCPRHPIDLSTTPSPYWGRSYRILTNRVLNISGPWSRVFLMLTLHVKILREMSITGYSLEGGARLRCIITKIYRLSWCVTQSSIRKK